MMPNAPSPSRCPSPLTTPSVFEYWDEAPHDWAHYLEREIDPTRNHLVLPILWGVHEAARGFYDFSKQSRLRVERVLSLCQSMGIRVEVVVGFPAHPNSFPEWAWRNDKKEMIPRRIWDPKSPYYVSLAVPSPNDPEIKDAFKSFLQEVMNLLGLYRGPEGPIKNIQLSLVPLEYSQNIASHPKHVKNIELRYKNIEEFNLRFQTNYRNFNSLGTASGCKFIEDKRPWLFSFDYQWSRRQIISEFVDEIRQLEALNSVNDILSLGNLPETQASFVDVPPFAIVFDSVSVQASTGSKDRLHPFWVEGILNGSSIHSFQWIRWLSEIANESGIPCIPLPSFETCNFGSGPLKAGPNQMVVGGKYQTKAARKNFVQTLQDGGNLFFPFGLPQYDEDQATLDWIRGATRENIQIENSELCLLRPKEGGQITIFANQTLNPLAQLSTDNLHQLFGIAKNIFAGASRG